MTYQQIAFNNPWAFAQTQKHWRTVPNFEDSWDKAESLLSGEPIWAAYTEHPWRNWSHFDRHGNPLFSLMFWNPILFVCAFSLDSFGGYRSWLNGTEVLLGYGLLVIPYVTKAYEFSMCSQGRFASVVIPAYIVLGQLLFYLPTWLAWGLLCASSSLLTCWSALYAIGQNFI
jgi:hypothetical protein